MASKLFLYDHPVSSYAQKVRMALREKGIEFDKETPQDLGSGASNSEFSSANPRMEVPALIDGHFKVFDSSAILAYLEEKYPQKPLLPPTPEGRAAARMIEDICDTHYEAINWAIGEIKWFERAKGDEADKLLNKAFEQTKQIQAWLTEQLGEKDFFNGDHLGYADICVAPIFNRSVYLGYSPVEGSGLQRWHARISKIPSIEQTTAEMVEGASKMSTMGADAWKPHWGRRREYRDHRLEWMIKNGGIGIVEQGLKDDNIRFSWPN